MTKSTLTEQYDRARGLLQQTRPIHNWSHTEETSLLLILMCWRREKLLAERIDMWAESKQDILDRLTGAYETAMEQFKRDDEYFGDL